MSILTIQLLLFSSSDSLDHERETAKIKKTTIYSVSMESKVRSVCVVERLRANGKEIKFHSSQSHTLVFIFPIVIVFINPQRLYHAWIEGKRTASCEYLMNFNLLEMSGCALDGYNFKRLYHTHKLNNDNQTINYY